MTVRVYARIENESPKIEILRCNRRRRRPIDDETAISTTSSIDRCVQTRDYRHDV